MFDDVVLVAYASAMIATGVVISGGVMCLLGMRSFIDELKCGVWKGWNKVDTIASAIFFGLLGVGLELLAVIWIYRMMFGV